MTQVTNIQEAWESIKNVSENIIQPLTYHEEHFQIGWNSSGEAIMMKKGFIVSADRIHGSRLDFTDAVAPWVIKTKEEFAQ